MAEMLELVDKEFWNTMINMLKVLMKKVDNTQEQMDNVREVEILRMKKKC